MSSTSWDPRTLYQTDSYGFWIHYPATNLCWFFVRCHKSMLTFICHPWSSRFCRHSYLFMAISSKSKTLLGERIFCTISPLVIQFILIGQMFGCFKASSLDSFHYNDSYSWWIIPFACIISMLVCFRLLWWLSSSRPIVCIVAEFLVRHDPITFPIPAIFIQISLNFIKGCSTFLPCSFWSHGPFISVKNDCACSP